MLPNSMNNPPEVNEQHSSNILYFRVGVHPRTQDSKAYRVLVENCGVLLAYCFPLTQRIRFNCYFSALVYFRVCRIAT